jgi:hypothetical protein
MDGRGRHHFALRSDDWMPADIAMMVTFAALTPNRLYQLAWLVGLVFAQNNFLFLVIGLFWPVCAALDALVLAGNDRGGLVGLVHNV